MKLQRSIFALCLSLLLISTLAIAQEDVLRPRGRSDDGDESYDRTDYLYRRSPFTLGIEAGLNYNMFMQDVTWTEPVPNSPNNLVKTGNGFSPLFSGLVDFSIAQNVGVQLRLSYDSKYFGNEYTGEMDCDLDIGEFTLVPVKTEFTNKLDYLGFAALFRFNFTPDFFLTAGPFLQVPLGDIKQTFDASIQDPENNCTFVSTGTPTMSIDTNLPKGPSRTGLEIGLGYKIPIARNIYLVPQGRFQFQLNKVYEDEEGIDIWQPETVGFVPVEFKNKKVHSAQFIIALWFEL